MGDSVFFICMLAAAGVFLCLIFSSVIGKAGLARDEAHIRQPGQGAIELGLLMAPKESPAWRLWFDDARLRYLAAERAWSTVYHRSGRKRKKAMLLRRLQLQSDIAEYIDPVDCLRRLATLAQESLEEPQPQGQPLPIEPG